MTLHRWFPNLLVLVVLSSRAQAAPVDYVRDIKPLLRRCQACHGPLKQEAGLRLDAARLILKGSEDGPILVAGNSEKSLIVKAVAGDGDFRMPPKGEGTPLSTQEIDLLKAWINQGAKGPANEEIIEDPRKHWSYQSPVRPRIPAVKNGTWLRNPIDAFVAAQHEKRGLQARPAADKSVLLRRVYLDLIGVPPTRDEFRAFLNDTSDDAYEKVVDQLMSSPQYGERWGRHWMDVWRYSDWYGRRGQKEIRYSQFHIWRWRDWIIESINDDKGYDRMIVEMLAGDEVAPDDPNVLRATGYLGRNWYKFDQNVWLHQTVEHTSMGFLAATLKCARCHDHKYDPVTQEEFYRFRAFFEPHEFRLDPVAGQPDTMKDGLARIYDAKIDAPTYLFTRGDDRNPNKERPLKPGVPSALGGPDLDVQSVSLPLDAYAPIGQMLAKSQAAVQAAEVAVAKSKDLAVKARKQLDEIAKTGNASESSTQEPFLVDDFAKSRPDTWKTMGGQWEYRNGVLLQKQVTTFATQMTLKNHPRNFKARVRYKNTSEGKYRSVGVFFDMVDKRDAQAVYTSANDTKPTVQAFHRKDSGEVYPPAGIVPCDVKVGREVTLEIEVRGPQLKISVDGQMKLDYRMPLPRQDGKFAIWSHNGTVEFLDVRVDPLVPTQKDAQLALQQAETDIGLNERKLATAQAELAALESRIEAERAKASCAATADSLALAAGKAERQVAVTIAEAELYQANSKLMVVRDGANWNDANAKKAIADVEKNLAAAQQKLQAARAAVDEPNTNYQPFKSTYPQTSTGRRLALARWMTDRRNPRTARVAVNHIWLRHFGVAIVPSVANFGLSGKAPSHPELLDWLTVELIESSWSMKRLHRLIVTSNTYRMKSSGGDSDHANLKVDPDNRYLWRMNWRRMEAEVVRDSLLSAAEQLDHTMGGAELAENLGQTSGRRSLYFRLTPDNKMVLLELFDLANPNECYERKESVIPQQALALTNSVVALSQARRLARRLTDDLNRDGLGVNERAFVTAAYEQVLNRQPSNNELTRCEQFLTEQVELLRSGKQLSAFPAVSSEAVAPAKEPAMRARENLVHVLFNHNDFVTIR